MMHEDSEPIHTWFELTYSSHLVLDPVVTGHLPQTWRDEVNAMLDQLEHSFPDVNRRGDQALAIAAQTQECGELTLEQMSLIEMTTNDDINDHSNCEHEDDDEDENWWCARERTYYYDWRGDEHGRSDRVNVPTETEEQAHAAGRRVVSRTLLQSMPAEWQARFVALMEQMEQAEVATAQAPRSYDIRFFTVDGHRTTDPVPYYSRGRTRLVPTVIAG